VKGTTGVPVRLRFTKHGKVRWIGHRDVARAMERAFRVAALPLAFSEGFSPHPKVSFGLALPTGHESDAEYLDLVLATDLDVEALPERLSAALPVGIEVTGVARLEDRAPALQEAVTTVTWIAEVEPPFEPGAVRVAVERGLAAASLPAVRRRKGREVTEDLRPVIRSATVTEVTEPAGGVVIELELATQPRSARPEEVLAAFGLTCRRARRTRQWIERDGARQEPLDADTRPRVIEARAS